MLGGTKLGTTRREAILTLLGFDPETQRLKDGAELSKEELEAVKFFLAKGPRMLWYSFVMELLGLLPHDGRMNVLKVLHDSHGMPSEQTRSEDEKKILATREKASSRYLNLK